MSLRVALLAVLALGCALGCARPAPQLTYLALERPSGVISTEARAAQELWFRRGGFYFLNHNFRPAADLAAYLREFQRRARAPILTDADVVLRVPRSVDLLFFGWTRGLDRVNAWVD